MGATSFLLDVDVDGCCMPIYNLGPGSSQLSSFPLPVSEVQVYLEDKHIQVIQHLSALVSTLQLGFTPFLSMNTTLV